MAFIFKTTSDGVQVQITIVWSRFRHFLTNIISLLWWTFSILMAVKAAGLDVIAILQSFWR